MTHSMRLRFPTLKQ
ncbi:erythromycin resistance leader peptide [Bacillus paralicheniformis]